MSLNKNELLEEIGSGLKKKLQGKTNFEIYKFFHTTLFFVKNYAASYELEGNIHLVLDNSIIQAIKHRKSKPSRAIDAEAYMTFCKFVLHWSDRKTLLALSPMAIYEHLGRRVPESILETNNTLQELQYILSPTSLEVRYLGFKDAKSLFSILINISADESSLTKYIKDLDSKSWKTDLSAPMGVKIPISIAEKSLPPLPDLKYFNHWYVHFVLSSRVERYIIDQSQHNPNALPICSGDLSSALAKLNTFRKNFLQGLGDIDILQICDICRQYHEKKEYLLVGQTLDKDLSEVLSRRHVFSISSEIIISDAPDQTEKFTNMMRMMFSRPFEENEKRGHHIHKKVVEFTHLIANICKTINS